MASYITLGQKVEIAQEHRTEADLDYVCTAFAVQVSPGNIVLIDSTSFNRLYDVNIARALKEKNGQLVLCVEEIEKLLSEDFWHIYKIK